MPLLIHSTWRMVQVGANFEEFIATNDFISNYLKYVVAIYVGAVKHSHPQIWMKHVDYRWNIFIHLISCTFIQMFQRIIHPKVLIPPQFNNKFLTIFIQKIHCFPIPQITRVQTKIYHIIQTMHARMVPPMELLCPTPA